MQKRYESNAARQSAYRDRKKKEEQVAEPEPEQVRGDPPPLERYVADALYMAELHHSQASPNATESTKSLADALERAEAYARWRYQGFVSGEISGL